MEEQNPSAIVGRRDTNINLCLAAAQAAMESGEYADADRLYKRGLIWSEERYGAQSAAVGLVLMEMVELYEKDGRQRDTARLQMRIGNIFRRYFFQSVLKKIEGS